MIVYISNYHLKGNKFLLSWFYNSEKLNSNLHTLNPETSYLICRYSWQSRQRCTKIKYVSNFGDNHFVLKNKKKIIHLLLWKIFTRWDGPFGCFLTFTVASGSPCLVSKLGIILGDKVHMDGLSYCSLTPQFKDLHLLQL